MVAAVLALVLLAGCSKGREPFGVIPTSEGFPVAIDRIVAIDAASGLPRVKQVRVGEQVYFTVLTAPRARCKVEFVWPEEGQEPKDLPSRDAGEEGYAEWNWKVREGTAVGQTVSVTFICHRQGDPGVSNAAVDSFEVIP